MPQITAGSAAPPLVPFAKLSIFYPMWNEQAYIERALHAGRRACEGLLRAGEIADYELIVVDDADVLVVGGDPIGDRTGGVGRRVVDDDQFVVGDLAAAEQDFAGATTGVEGALDVRLFVPQRIEDRELGERHERWRGAPRGDLGHGR